MHLFMISRRFISGAFLCVINVPESWLLVSRGIIRHRISARVWHKTRWQTRPTAPICESHFDVNLILTNMFDFYAQARLECVWAANMQLVFIWIWSQSFLFFRFMSPSLYIQLRMTYMCYFTSLWSCYCCVFHIPVQRQISNLCSTFFFALHRLMMLWYINLLFLT